MLSIRAIRAGNEDYYLEPCRRRLLPQRRGASWKIGWEAAAGYSISPGIVEAAEFKRFFRGFHPVADDEAGPKDGPPETADARSKCRARRIAKMDGTSPSAYPKASASFGARRTKLYESNWYNSVKRHSKRHWRGPKKSLAIHGLAVRVPAKC